MPPPGELNETYASFLILAIRCIMYKHEVIHTSRKYITYRIAVSGGPSHGHRQDVPNIWRNLDVWVFLFFLLLIAACKSYFVALVLLSLRFVYDVKLINKQTNRHADRTPTGAKVNINPPI